MVKRIHYIKGVIVARELPNHEESFIIKGLLLLPTKAFADTDYQN